MNKLFFPEVAKQTIYFQLFAEQKSYSHPQESNGAALGLLAKLSCNSHVTILERDTLKGQ